VAAAIRRRMAAIAPAFMVPAPGPRAGGHHAGKCRLATKIIAETLLTIRRKQWRLVRARCASVAIAPAKQRGPVLRTPTIPACYG